MKVRKELHVYLTENGRISLAGMNIRNLDYFAIAVDQVARENR